MRPEKIGVMFAREVGKLCRMCDDQTKVVDKLRTVIGRRISKGKMMEKYGETMDIANVHREIAAEKGVVELSTLSTNKPKRSDKRCKCKDEEVLELVVALSSKNKSMDRRKAFEKVMRNGLDVLCKQHLRIFAGDAVGLLNSRIKNDGLRDWLEMLYDARDDWDSFTTENRHWFRKWFRVPSDGNDLGIHPFRRRRLDSMHVPFSNVLREREVGKGGREMGRS
jgi:hypothetical protein